jgi:hypothetical protein
MVFILTGGANVLEGLWDLTERQVAVVVGNRPLRELLDSLTGGDTIILEASLHDRLVAEAASHLDDLSLH